MYLRLQGEPFLSQLQFNIIGLLHLSVSIRLIGGCSNLPCAIITDVRDLVLMEYDCSGVLSPRSDGLKIGMDVDAFTEIVVELE